ncbi:hypothetical protein F2Q69_00013510 [Brassica cretica]|uniref:Uncharacterized protein n=1 Tax=Brassica cretica TaxID=69181 RepID=A0A8S9R626_BRACR|nr:hypothetical protein F2Q69_00013510 [Brassica cretica]
MRKGWRRDDAVLYVHPRTKTGKLRYRYSSQKNRRSEAQDGIVKSDQAWKKRKGRSSRKKDYAAKKEILCEGIKAEDVLFKISDLKNLQKRSSKLQTMSSMADSKNLMKHYQGWVLYRETVSHLGPKKKFQPTKNPKYELLECCPARGIPAENEQPRLT